MVVIEQNEVAEEGDKYTLSCVAYRVKPTPLFLWSIQCKQIKPYIILPKTYIVNIDVIILYLICKTVIRQCQISWFILRHISIGVLPWLWWFSIQAICYLILFLCVSDPDGSSDDLTSVAKLTTIQLSDTSLKVSSSLSVALTRYVQGSRFTCETDLRDNSNKQVYYKTTQTYMTNAMCKYLKHCIIIVMPFLKWVMV